MSIVKIVLLFHIVVLSYLSAMCEAKPALTSSSEADPVHLALPESHKVNVTDDATEAERVVTLPPQTDSSPAITLESPKVNGEGNVSEPKPIITPSPQSKTAPDADPESHQLNIGNSATDPKPIDTPSLQSETTPAADLESHLLNIGDDTTTTSPLDAADNPAEVTRELASQSQSDFKPAPEQKSNHPDGATEANIKENLIDDDDIEFLSAYSNRMLSYMNRSVDPCDDFYEYACGNWKHVKLDKQISHKRSNLLDIVYTLGDVVEQLLTKSSVALNLDYAKEHLIAQQFYNACLSAELYTMKAADDAYLTLIKSIGGFPAVDATWQAANFSWFNMSAHLTNFGADGLINDKILPQYPFPPYFKLPELGFDYIVHSDNIASNTTRGYKLNEKRMRGYLSSYGLAESEIVAVINGVFAFWQDVLKIADRFDEDSDQCALLTDINDVPEFPQWSNYYEIAWQGQQFDDTYIGRYCDFYYTELDKVCEQHKSAVANYLAMKLLYKMDAKLTAAKYQRDYCLLYMQVALPHFLNKLYVLEFFTGETRVEIGNIVKELRKSLRIELENADWLDDSTRKEALEKESTILPRIGSYKDPELTDRLIREMNNLTISPDNFAQNNINMKRFSTFAKRYNGNHHAALPNTTKPLELLVGMQVNAFYYNVDNSINVMEGILHPPAYHKSWPNSLKFGTIGYLIGHELTHGFDTVGSTYDSTGDNRNWWSKKSGAVFNERAQCYVDHYNGYLVPEINRKINGNQTKDENIADGGGLREALNAYRSYMKQLTNSEDTYSLKNERMPGLDLSPEQLFFLGFAQLWCAAYEEEHYWEELTNEHTMDKYRVLGAVTNNDDFSKVYNCSLGSPMNPQPGKCRIW